MELRELLITKLVILEEHGKLGRTDELYMQTGRSGRSVLTDGKGARARSKVIARSRTA